MHVYVPTSDVPNRPTLLDKSGGIKTRSSAIVGALGGAILLCSRLAGCSASVSVSPASEVLDGGCEEEFAARGSGNMVVWFLCWSCTRDQS